MRVAVIANVDKPLKIANRAIRASGCGELVVRVPAGIDPCDAAPLTAAGVTTYKAVNVAGIRPGDRVAVFGLGGLGHLALHYAQIFGAETVAVEFTAEKLQIAQALGATHVVNAATTDPVAAIAELGGADVAMVLAASAQVIEQAHACLRRGGRLVLVSIPKDDTMALPVFVTITKGIRVIGAFSVARAELADVFRLHTAGHTSATARTTP
jgi:propanol-preferring alcohol dehydrogenase